MPRRPKLEIRNLYHNRYTDPSECGPAMVDLRALFNRVPDDIVLAASSRDIRVHDLDTCLVAWVVREHLARLQQCDAEAVDTAGVIVDEECPRYFGGTHAEWETVYIQVADETPDGDGRVIELAWVERIQAAVRRARVYRAYGEAAKEPSYRTDMASLNQAFDAATADGLAERAFRSRLRRIARGLEV